MTECAELHPVLHFCLCSLLCSVTTRVHFLASGRRGCFLLLLFRFFETGFPPSVAQVGPKLKVLLYRFSNRNTIKKKIYFMHVIFLLCNACMYVYFMYVCLHICIACMCTYMCVQCLVEARGGHRIPWNWNNRWLWATIWVLWTELGSFARARTLNLSASSPTPRDTFQCFHRI